MGNIPAYTHNNRPSSLFATTQSWLDSYITHFWELEQPPTDNSMSYEENFAETHLQATLKTF